jgi:hypothetical protein
MMTRVGFFVAGLGLYGILIWGLAKLGRPKNYERLGAYRNLVDLYQRAGPMAGRVGVGLTAVGLVLIALARVG